MKYCCETCGSNDCKLFRELSTFDISLVCWTCLEEKGHKIDLAQSDQVYNSNIEGWCYGPAVPDLDGRWWGYTSVPAWWCAWWKSLPDKKTDCQVCLGAGKLDGKYDCCFCKATGQRSPAVADIPSAGEVSDEC